MTEWHIYKKDDPNTWPKINCPILVYDENWCDFYICKWNQELGRFVEPKSKLLHYWKECYYQYIGYVPNGYRVHKTKKCTLRKGMCEYKDDGYCFDAPEDMNCEFCEEVIEYYVDGNKRVWKEF